MTVHAIRELKTELGVFAQFVEEARGTLIVVKCQRVGLDAFQRAFGIPNEKMERAGWAAPAGGVPVGSVVPVGVGAVEVQYHEVNEAGHIEQFLHGLIGLGTSQTG